MISIDLWKVLSELNTEIVSDINKIIIFGENGSEVIFSTIYGKVYGFGNNRFGGLGLGHKNAVKEPQNIEMIKVYFQRVVIDFSYGAKHVLAKTITGKLYSWGDNSYGQLGIGTNTSDYRPKLIDSLSDKCVIAMSCGSYHTLVLTDDNQLYGFGYNSYGQIGCGNTSTQLKPIIINGFNYENLISISCGNNHSLALTQTGNVYAWGQGNWGQLGVGNKLNKNIPTKIVISIGLLFKQIACGDSHSLLLSECGDVYAFGYNSCGCFGTGNTVSSCVPIKISGLKNITDIASHFRLNISMAKSRDNTCLVWGQCLTENILKPKQTRFKSFNDIIAIYSKITITVKPIEKSLKTNKLMESISEKFNDKSFSNIVFKVGDKQIFVNKFILRVNSDYFKNKYSVKSTEITESSTESFDDIENIEVINNYSYEVFYSYLKYIYTECVEIENQYLDQLLILSIDYKEEDLRIQCYDKYFSSNNNLIKFESIVKLMKYSIDNNFNELKAKCIDRIKSIKTIENVCNVYEVSIKYGFNDLKNNCIEYMRGLNEKNIILKTDSYNKLSKELRLEITENLLI